MKHYRITHQDGVVRVHAEGYIAPGPGMTLCGHHLLAAQNWEETTGTLEKHNKISCPECIKIITHCKTALLQEYN